MRALLFHAKEYKMNVTGLATRPAGIEPEPIVESEQEVKNCIVAFVCVERSDESGVENQLFDEIKKMMAETGESKVVVAPFAHLSNQLADSALALKILNSLSCKFSSDVLTRTHFGSDKELLLSIFGHPGNVRFREF